MRREKTDIQTRERGKREKEREERRRERGHRPD